MKLEYALAALAGIVTVCAIALFFGYVPAAISPKLTGEHRAEYIAQCFGAIATVLGLVSAGWIAGKQIKLDLERRSKDQRLTAKREVIASGVIGLNKMVTQISRLISPNSEEDELGFGYNDGYEKASTLWVMCDLENLPIIQDTADDIGRTYTTLLFERTNIRIKQSEVKFHETELNKISEQQEQLIRDIKHSSTFHEEEAIRSRIEDIKNESREVFGKWMKSQHEYNEMQIPFIFKCLKQSRRLRNKYRRVIAALRIELEIDQDNPSHLSDYDLATTPDDEGFRELFKEQFPNYINVIDEIADMGDVDHVFNKERYPPVRRR